MKIFKLAFRNVFRNKRRTLISISVLMIGAMGLGIFSGFMNFTYWAIQEHIIHVGMGTPEGTGHFQIYNAEYFKGEEPGYLAYGISDWKDITNKIEKIPDVTFASPRIDMLGLISTGEKAEPVVGFAVDPKKEKILPETFGSSEPYLKLEKVKDGVILGRELAKKLKVKEGEYLTLLSSTIDGAINGIDLKFIGTIDTGTPEGNQRFILVNLKSAMGLFQTDKVRKIVVFFRERGGENRQCVDMEGSKTAISNLFPNGNYHIKTWQELNNYYNSVRAIYNTIFGFIGIVMAIVVILSIYNTMYMVVVERTREIGTLMAVGTPRRYVLLLFLFEGLIVAVVGAILGYGGTYIASRIINHAGLVMPPPPGGTQGYPLLIQAVYLNWIYIAFFIMFNTIVACFWPAYKGAKMAIVKALYHV